MSRCVWRRLVGVVAAASVVVLSGCGDASYAVRGTVKHNGQPLTDSGVALVVPSGRVVGTQPLTEAGEFAFAAVPAGTYTIVLVPGLGVESTFPEAMPTSNPAETEAAMRKNEPAIPFDVKYTAPATSGLTYEIGPDRPTDLSIELR